MIFRAFLACFFFATLVLATSCKTCYQCSVEYTDLDSMTVDTATSAYPQICGTKKDIEGYEKLCFTTYDGDTNTTSNTAYKCICGETL